MTSNAFIQDLYIYPIKSLGAVKMLQAELTQTGLRFDRQWMLINPKGQMVSQRIMPKLGLIDIEFQYSKFDELENGELHFNHKLSGERFSISILELQQSCSNESFQANIWREEVLVQSVASKLSDWLTRVSEARYKLQLVKMAPAFKRITDQSAKSGSLPAVENAFADGYPLLVCNQASLDELNQSLDGSVSMKRFRPNIVVTGLAPFEEHRVKGFETHTGAIEFQYPCERCVMTTLSELTAQKNPNNEPLETLKKLNPMPGTVNAAAFGENAILTNSGTIILQQGQSINLTEKLL